VLHLAREAPRKMRRMLPAHVWALVAPYGLLPGLQSEDRKDKR
jgi:coenzyme F420 hydrogenase subunit beta